jgi:DNA-dependent RNA polymerase auxiliary subunit epsilon
VKHTSKHKPRIEKTYTIAIDGDSHKKARLFLTLPQKRIGQF